MSIETMKQALDWMEWFAGDDHSIRPKSKALDIAQALRQAIEQEPDKYAMDIECTNCGTKQSGILTVNTTPPQRQPLTDEEIRKAKHHMVEGAYHYSFQQGVRYAEAAHGIKGEA